MVQFQQPRGKGGYDEEGFNDPLTQDTSGLENISGKAQKSIGDIDDVLAENEKAKIADQEAAGDTLGKGFTGKGGLAAAALGASEASGAGSPFSYTGKGSRGGKISKTFWTKKKAGAVGSLVGVSAFSITALLGVASGPASLINAASFLNVASQGNASVGDEMTMRAMYYALIGNANRGRLGVLMTRPADKQALRIERAVGVKIGFVKGGTNRQAGFIITDMEKARASGLLNEIDPDGTKLKEGLDTVVDSHGNSSKGSQFLDLKEVSFGELRKFNRLMVDSANMKGIVGFSTKRLMIKRAGVKMKIFNGARQKADQSTEAFKNLVQEDLKRNITEGADAPEGELAKEVREAAASGDEEKIKTTKVKLNPATKIAGGAVAGVAIACAARDLSNGYTGYVQKNFVQPMIRLSTMFKVGASQAQAGGDQVSLDEVGVVNAMFTNKDAPLGQQEFTDADAIKHLENRGVGVKTPEGAKVSTEKPTALKTVDEAYDSVSIEGVNPLDGGCNVIAAAGELPGIQQINELTSFAIDSALSVFNLSTEKLIEGMYGLMSGPAQFMNFTGGELGAVAMEGSFFDANDQASAMGGSFMTQAQAAQMLSNSLDDIAYEKSKESVFDRYLNVYSANSLASKVVNGSPTSTGSLAGIFKDPIHTVASPLQSVAAVFNDKATAAEPAYNYGLPYKGIPTELLADPAYTDPNINELAIQDNLAALNEKFSKCYGTSIDPSTSALVTMGGVNDLETINMPECNGQDNGNLVTDSENYTRSEKERYGMLIAYATAVYASDCFEGGESSCTMLGIPNEEGGDTGVGAAPSGGVAGYGATEEQFTGYPEEIKSQCKAGTATGNILMLCNGAKYIDQVVYNMVHPYTGKTFSERWAAGERDLTLDCSLFVGTMLWESFKFDFTSTSQEYYDPENFDKVPISDMKPGDLVVTPGHIAISLDPANKKVLNSSGNNSPAGPKNDLWVSNQASGVSAVLRYKGGMK